MNPQRIALSGELNLGGLSFAGNLTVRQPLPLRICLSKLIRWLPDTSILIFRETIDD
jgi:hypothetical protein